MCCTAPQPATRRWPTTFWVGLTILVAAEALLLCDLRLSGRGALPDRQQVESLPAPAGWSGSLARWVAVNMTPIAWLGYIILLDGLLQRQSATSPIRRRPHHFATLSLASIVIWCIFDAINFNLGMRAWTYLGMPPTLARRFTGYVIAFGAIVPGMLLSGQVLLNAGAFDWARSSAWRMPRRVIALSLLGGVAMLIWPLWARSPVTNLTLWTSLVFLLDPINLMLGRPSMLRDWQNGWYGRTLAAFAGGLICGLLWEFWNFYAIAKWTYHLPFLGAAENIRYFEMPLPGLLGFLPFGMECWVMWQFMRIPLDGLVEPLPDDRTLQ